MNLARLLQLASPTLPVGAYSYSGGLEAAIEAGIVRDAASAERWIGDVLEFSVCRMELPLFLRMMEKPSELENLNIQFLASRETAELRAESVQMGYSLRRLLRSLWGDRAAPLDAHDELSYPAAFAFACARWDIAAEPAATAYLWSWLENQVLAAVKAVPLGQTDGQSMLVTLGEAIPAHVHEAAARGDGEIENFAPGLALASARHETQYSRLFRS